MYVLQYVWLIANYGRSLRRLVARFLLHQVLCFMAGGII